LRGEKKSPDVLEKRCRRENRKTYRWKPGDPQPDNTVKIPEITWWQLKRAAGGQPCPPWRGDEYYKQTTKKHTDRGKRFGLDLLSVVRSRDLGKEPDVNQYEHWKKVWDDVIRALGEPPVAWDNLKEIGRETEYSMEISPQKAREERMRSRGEDLDRYKVR